MAGQNRRLRPVVGLVAALLISVGWAATPAPANAALPAWTGGVNLYRTGVFTTQKSWLWCTAADVQIMRNMKYHREDHSRAAQSRYFTWMRARNRYSLPLSAGVDPQGWTAGLRHFVDDRYRLMSSATFLGAIRLAVRRIRLTNLPVALAVAHGNHGWVLHGFTATADPATTNDFRITSVRVTGPLWGLQNSSFGYDMRPNTKITPGQLQRFFTPWRYAPKRMIWDGRFVSIQPVPLRSSTATTTTAASVGPTAQSSVVPSAAPSPAITAASSPAVGAVIPSALPAADAREQRDLAPQPLPADARPVPDPRVGVAVGLVLLVAVALVLAGRQRSWRRIE